LSRSQTKVPLLGDIPFLGALFRNSSDSYDKISTVMILTPYIVSSSRELTKLQKKLKEMEDTKQEISMKMQRALEKIKNDQAKSHSPEDEVF
jgi:type II secretory pathway component GspD/PulD (secretin)